MTYAQLKQQDPFAADLAVRWGARGAKRAGSTAAYAAARGISESRARHERAGSSTSLATDALAAFHLLSAGEGTTAIPLLMEAWAVTMRRKVVDLDNTQLQTLIRDLDQRIHFADARKNQRATEAQRGTPEDDDDCADADMETGELLVHRAEARRERANRKRRGTW